MKIAVVTKPDMTDCLLRGEVVEAMRADAYFDVVECVRCDDIPLDSDAVLVFGGDGTVLDAIRFAGEKDIAVLGVNLGNMGFLSSFEKDVKPQTVLDAFKDGRYASHMLLNVEACSLTATALNEVVIKSGGARPIFLDVSVDGRYVDSYHSDGLIISSPIGSTAYSLSAGGPIVAPNVDAFVINPICAHSLHSRPMVVGADSEIAVRLGGDVSASLIVDGRNCLPFGAGDCVKITRSSHAAKFIALDGGNFYNKLLKKMNRWGTTLR